ncbi:ATP-binding protein [soil metagenome]
MTQSLRLRLILLLGIAIVAAALIQFATSFRAAMEEANKLFDYHMQQMAITLKDNDFQHFDWYTLPDSPSVGFDFVIQVWSEEGARVYQSGKFRVLPERADPGYSTVAVDGDSWRIYALRTHKQVIQISQRIQTRRDRAISLASHSLWPIVPVSLLLLAAAWAVITSALTPLNRIGQGLAARDVDSFEPVTGTGVPREVLPLVAALNSLLARFAQTLQSQRQFVADAAHELRTPLTALKLQVQTLARAKDELAREQAIARLEGGIDRATRLVEQLLALARQDPAVAVGQARVSMTACMQQVLSDLQPLAELKQVDLRSKRLDAAEVSGDEESLRIMLRNLVDNAVRYTPSGGCVEVVVETTRDRILLTVEDSGSGLALAERSRVFDRFYRVAGSGASGSGLGLAIVKAIAERHKASIELGDAALGGLSVRVIFSVPAASPT